MPDDRAFTTDSLALAAFLSLSGMKLLGTEWRVKRSRSKCYWRFEVTQQLEDLVSDYALNEALVDPQAYNDRMQELKQEMFHEQDSRAKRRGAAI